MNNKKANSSKKKQREQEKARSESNSTSGTFESPLAQPRMNILLPILPVK